MQETQEGADADDEAQAGAAAEIQAQTYLYDCLSTGKITIQEDQYKEAPFTTVVVCSMLQQSLRCQDHCIHGLLSSSNICNAYTYCRMCPHRDRETTFARTDVRTGSLSRKSCFRSCSCSSYIIINRHTCSTNKSCISSSNCAVSSSVM